MLTERERNRYKSVKRANTKPAKKNVQYDGTGYDMTPRSAREDQNRVRTYERELNRKPAKAAYDDGNGTTFLNSKPKKQIKDQQNNSNVYGKVTAVNGKSVKKKKGR
jgi:hypothetical protein